jgi:hypothetical protein
VGLSALFLFSFNLSPAPAHSFYIPFKTERFVKRNKKAERPFFKEIHFISMPLSSPRLKADKKNRAILSLSFKRGKWKEMEESRLLRCFFIFLFLPLKYNPLNPFSTQAFAL